MRHSSHPLPGQFGLVLKAMLQLWCRANTGLHDNLNSIAMPPLWADRSATRQHELFLLIKIHEHVSVFVCLLDSLREQIKTVPPPWKANARSALISLHSGTLELPGGGKHTLKINKKKSLVRMFWHLFIQVFFFFFKFHTWERTSKSNIRKSYRQGEKHLHYGAIRLVKPSQNSLMWVSLIH